MKSGHVRDNLPHLVLALPTLSGNRSIKFIVDTGFDGELTLPIALINQVDAQFTNERLISLADGTRLRRSCYEIAIEWETEQRMTEILVLEGNLLLGSELLYGSLLQIEMTDGGEVSIEPL